MCDLNSPTMKYIKLVCVALVCVGAINWLTFVNLENGNLVHRYLQNEDGSVSNAEKAVYNLVGVAGIILAALTICHLSKYGIDYKLCSALKCAPGDLECYKLL